jgi:hypothetical protein
MGAATLAQEFIEVLIRGPRGTETQSASSGPSYPTRLTARPASGGPVGGCDSRRQR